MSQKYRNEHDISTVSYFACDFQYPYFSMQEIDKLKENSSWCAETAAIKCWSPTFFSTGILTTNSTGISTTTSGEILATWNSFLRKTLPVLGCMVVVFLTRPEPSVKNLWWFRILIYMYVYAHVITIHDTGSFLNLSLFLVIYIPYIILPSFDQISHT